MLAYRIQDHAKNISLEQSIRTPDVASKQAGKQASRQASI